MRYVILMSMASAGGVHAQAASMCAFSRYQGQPIEAITSVRRAPMSDARTQNGSIYTFTGSTASMATSTSSTMGFIGNTQGSATTTSAMPITIHSRVQLFTDTDKRVIGFEGEYTNGTRSSMFHQLSHQ